MIPSHVWLARAREWTELAKSLNDPEMVRIFNYLAAEAVAVAAAEVTVVPRPVNRPTDV